MRASSYHIARIHMRLPRPCIKNKTAARRRDRVRVTKPRPPTRYFGSSRNRRRRTIPYPQREVTRPSEVSYNIDVLFICSPYRCHRIFCIITAFLASRAIRKFRKTAYVRTPISYSMCEACGSRNTGVSNVPKAVVAWVSNLRECARRTDHAIATRLVAEVRDVAFTSLAASFTHVLLRHGTGKFRYDVIMSFDLILRHIDSFRGVYLFFEHYIFTAQTAVDDHHILPNVFLESDQFRDPRPVGQIDTGSLE